MKFIYKKVADYFYLLSPLIQNDTRNIINY